METSKKLAGLPTRAANHPEAHNHAEHEHSDNQHGHVPIGAGGQVGLVFRLSLICTILFVIIELVMGLWANSLALISDAGHNLTDAMALAFSWLALAIGRRSPTSHKTYGY